MFSENLIILRKQKGLSQEALAIKLNVVRQTVSKWEKGLSVPDADMLIRLAEIFEVSVSQLLGEKIENEESQDNIAEHLSQIAEQMAIKNRRAKRIWKIIAGIVIAIIVVNLLLVIMGIARYSVIENGTQTSEEIVCIYQINGLSHL